MNKWIINKPDEKITALLKKQTDLSSLCIDVLAAREITTAEQAAKFINCDKLSDPFLLKDMHEAAQIINEAVDSGKSICIYGDYDCDGITSTVMLYSYLDCLGADVTYYIPERSEGYGMNCEAVRQIAEGGTELIITVDNGISSHEEAELIAELGMELVITDHHQPGEALPMASAIVNPHRSDDCSPYKSLCGAGVVLKLIAALDGGDYDAVSEQFGELAAIGTVADVVNLDGENRSIVQNGLLLLQNTERCGLISLIKICGLENKALTSTSIAFMLAPRINAAGRFGSPKQAVQLLLCEEYDSDEADRLANELNALNTERKKTENEIIKQIELQINEQPELLNERVLIFDGENWHHGVIGIVASRMMELFGKPCIIITMEGELSRGSARSFGSFSIYKCLDECRKLLIKYGGHLGAGGFSLKTEDISAFKEKIKAYSLKNFDTMPVLEITADMLLKPSQLTVSEISGLNVLEPFGEANQQPLFALIGAKIDDIQAISNGAHTKLKLNYSGIGITALIFRKSTCELNIARGEQWDFLASLNVNSYNGRDSVVAIVKDCRRSGIKQNSYFAAKLTYDKYIRGETLPSAYYARLCPKREELVAIYKALTENPVKVDTLFMSMSENTEINYCKLRLCLDIFTELGLSAYNPYNDEIFRLPVKGRTDLDKSEILRGLRNKL